MLNKSGLHLNEYGTTQLVNNFCYHMTILEVKKNIKVQSKKVINICLNSSVANTGRPIISKINRLKENLNDANRSFKNNEECSNAFQLVYRLQNPKNIVIGRNIVISMEISRNIVISKE